MQMMFRNFRQFRQLSLQEQWWLLRLAGVMLFIRMALRLFPFRWIKGLWNRWIARLSRSQTSSRSTDHICWGVNIVGSRLAPSYNFCLVKGLTACYFFYRNGYPVQLVNGVKTTSAPFKAHAWVRYQNRTLIGARPDLTRYTPLYTLQPEFR